MKNVDWNKVEGSVFKHGLLMEQVWYVLHKTAENCITLNFLEGLEGNAEEIVDGSAFKLY